MTPTVDMEPNLTPFETTLNDPFGGAGELMSERGGVSSGREKCGTSASGRGKSNPVYLIPSPEIQIKKLLGAGFGNVYTITKVFRNGEIGGGRHNPEFTMLEWYRENASYKDIMEDCEDLVLYLVEGLKGEEARGGFCSGGDKLGICPVGGEVVIDDSGEVDVITYQGRKIDLKKPWDRISIHELFLKYCGIDLLKFRDFESLAKVAEDHGYSVSGTVGGSGSVSGGCKTWDDIFYKIFLNEIEPKLGFNKPVIVYDYPATQRALAKKAKDPFWVERFELYIAGHELCNAFSELTDSKEQRARLVEDRETRKKMGKTQFDIDEEFLASLESIRRPYGGNALGVDRLMMVLLDKPSISDVILFPMEEMLRYKI